MASDGPGAAAAMLGGAGILVVAAQFAPARRALARLRPSGSGPTAAQREKAWFNVRFVGEGGGTRVVTEVAGGDPGYTETAKMIGEAAISLAVDDLDPTSGQVTTASALGPALRTRLQAAGISFTVLE
jgi:saccharopine dehydrogenase (NAD+, L-glutamate forming)